MQDQIGGIFNIGPHTVDYTVRDKIGLESYCSFKIKVNGMLIVHYYYHSKKCMVLIQLSLYNVRNSIQQTNNI